MAWKHISVTKELLWRSDWVITGAAIDHGALLGLGDNDHPQYLLVTDIDDTPVNGETAQPISSNWAFDHVAAADPHTGYILESLIDAAGDLIVGTADNTVGRLAKGTDDQVLTMVAGAVAWADAAGGGGSTLDVAQATHGFAVGDVLYHNGTIYAKAAHTSEALAEVIGIVSEVTDTDNFVLLTAGPITGLSGLTAGTVYFLSSTAGALTATEPTTAGYISKPLLIAYSTTAGIFFNMRGMEVNGTPTGDAIITPQGRLTLTTATPVMTAEAAAQTTIYYTPYVGNRIPLYDGTVWTNTSFSELSIAMAASANWAANSNYDLYVYNDGGTLRLGTGAAWTSDTARNESLAMLNGILTNNASMTLRYGASSTVSVAANRATYVGTFRTTGSTGTTTWVAAPTAAAGGGTSYLYLWNAYNRRMMSGRALDSTNSWTYATDSWRAINNNANNAVNVVIGLAEDVISASYRTWCDTTSASGSPSIGVGYDSTTDPSGFSNLAYNNTGFLLVFPLTANMTHFPGIGKHTYTALERARGAISITNYGDNGSAADWENGIDLQGMF